MWALMIGWLHWHVIQELLGIKGLKLFQDSWWSHGSGFSRKVVCTFFVIHLIILYSTTTSVLLFCGTGPEADLRERLRCQQVSDHPGVLQQQRRDADPHVYSSPPRPGLGRQPSGPLIRLWRLQHLNNADLQRQPTGVHEPPGGYTGCAKHSWRRVSSGVVMRNIYWNPPLKPPQN